MSLVIDTSTLLLLAKASLLEQALDRFPVTLPEEVRIEALAKPSLPDAMLIARLIKTGRLKPSPAISPSETRAIAEDFNLGSGESAALAVALKTGAIVGTDDGACIRAAKVLGVEFITALHVLIQLYREGEIDKDMADAKLALLARFGRYSESILADCRAKLRRR